MDTGFTINQSTENMILPLPVYEQVPLRVALAFEPQSLKEIRRSLISRHMISYNAVQLYLIKCIVDSVGRLLVSYNPGPRKTLRRNNPYSKPEIHLLLYY